MSIPDQGSNAAGRSAIHDLIMSLSQSLRRDFPAEFEDQLRLLEADGEHAGIGRSVARYRCDTLHGARLLPQLLTSEQEKLCEYRSILYEHCEEQEGLRIH